MRECSEKCVGETKMKAYNEMNWNEEEENRRERMMVSEVSNIFILQRV